MGLDMYAYATEAQISSVDFQKPADSEELYYWRKHPNLHGWMELLYRFKGGVDEFNLTPVRLTAEDLAVLEKDVRNDQLPRTTGFFFGESRPEEKIRDLDFIERAQKAIASGKAVFYTSWW